MKTIIVPIDFSDCSYNALEHALSIARKGGIDVKMIWVNKPEGRTPLFLEDGSDQISVVEKEFKSLIKKYQPTLPDSSIAYMIKEGKVHTEVINEAMKDNAFLIVTGTHGVSGFEEMWIGSNANKIVSNAPCPVITIRGGVSIKRDLNTIVLPIDSTDETRQKVPFTALIAQFFHAEVHVVCFYSTKVQAIRRRVDSYAQQSLKYLMENKVKLKVDSIEAKNQVEDIINYSLSVNANLISIMSEMEKSARNIWLGSYAQQLVNTSPLPVLISHPKEYLSGTIGF